MTQHTIYSAATADGGTSTTDNVHNHPRDVSGSRVGSLTSAADSNFKGLLSQLDKAQARDASKNAKQPSGWDTIKAAGRGVPRIGPKGELK